MNPYEVFFESATTKKRLRVLLMTLAALLIYVACYVSLSRQGFAKADAIELKGLWFSIPKDGKGWRRHHYTCVVVFSPLIVVDNFIGTGRPLVPEPIWDLGP
jgi:hypothetical protein